MAQVRANFTDTCSDAVSDEELMCSQIEVDQMSGDEDTLIVSTTLDPSSKSQGQAICEWIALLYFDGVTGQDLGYRLVDIRDRDDGNAAACSVEQ